MGKIKNIILSLGTVLSIIGVPLAMYFNHFIPLLDWTPIFMVSSFFFVTSFKNLYQLRFPSFHKFMLIILVFQLITLVFGILDDKVSSQYLFFHLYVISMILAFSSVNFIDFRLMLKSFFYVTMILSLFGAYVVFLGLVGTQDYWVSIKDGAFKLEAFTVAFGVLMNLLVSLSVVKSKIKVFKLFLYLAILLDIYVLFGVSKRTPVLIALIAFGVYIFEVIKKNKSAYRLVFKYSIIFIFIFVSLYILLDSFQTKIDDLALNTYYGVLNLLGNTDVLDKTGSAISRVKSRIWVYDYINNRFTFFNYLFGAGYMTRWIDNPILQSYLDFGIFGIIFYIWIIIWFPIKQFFKSKNEFQLLCLFFCLYALFSSINSGNPYMQFKYIPVVLLSWSISVYYYKKPKVSF